MLVMERKASDNKYLHRDFHISADNGIEYVGEKYGDEGVKEFLSDFARSYFQLLVKEYKRDGLKAIAKYIKRIYETEEASDSIELTVSDKNLTVKVKYCPAVKYMRSQGHVPSRWYKLSTFAVYNRLAIDCGIKFVGGEYDEETGATEFEFIEES